MAILSDPAALVERLAPFQIVCAMRERTKFPRAVLERLPNLQLLASTGARNAAIDLEAASDLGVAVAHTEGRHQGAAELTWALILSAVRHIPDEVASVRAGRWQVGMGQDLDGMTLGVVGLGKLGAVVARIGLAFSMRVIGWSQNLDPAHARSLGVEPVSKDQLFREADIVTLHLVLSERSRGTVGDAELSAMKPTAWLINTSRGPLVDEAALIEALTAKRIAGAALDTFDVEPLPAGHAFRRLPNVIATPHVGYVTEAAYRDFYGQTVENIVGWLDAAPVRTSLPKARRA